MTHWLFWLIGTIGLGGVIFGGAVLILGWPVVLAFLQTKIGRTVLAIGAAIGGALLLYQKGQDEGLKRAAEQRERERQAAIKAKGESDATVDRLDDSHVKSELDEWLRDGPKR